MASDDEASKPSPLEQRDPKSTKWAKEEGRRIALGEEPTEYQSDEDVDIATPSPVKEERRPSALAEESTNPESDA